MILHMALSILGGFCVGWVARAQQPFGIEYHAWRRAVRLYHKARRRA